MKRSTLICWITSTIAGLMIGLGLPPNGSWPWLASGITLFIVANGGKLAWDVWQATKRKSD